MSTRLAIALLAPLLFLLGCCCGPGACCSGGGCTGPLGGCVGPRVKNALSCNGGCGNVYIGEWISDPPDCCDPCDQCGNFTGQDCGRRGVFGCWRPCWPWLPALSARFGESCGGCGGCSQCADGGVVHDGEVHSYAPSTRPQYQSPPVLHDQTWDQPAPRPAPGVPTRTGQRPVPHKTTRTVKPRPVQPVAYEEELEPTEDVAPVAPTPSGRRNYAR